MDSIGTRKLSLPIHVAQLEEERNICKFWWGTLEERHQFLITMLKWEDNIKVGLRERNKMERSGLGFMCFGMCTSCEFSSAKQGSFSFQSSWVGGFRDFLGSY